jgi:hypothetical protein
MARLEDENWQTNIRKATALIVPLTVVDFERDHGPIKTLTPVLLGSSVEKMKQCITFDKKLSGDCCLRF